jgi:hypothetical protein
MLDWTDSKIRVHGLYCTIALLRRALMYRRVMSLILISIIDGLFFLIIDGERDISYS